MRERLNISDEHIQSCLRDRYNLSASSLEFLPLGLDSRAGVYRVMSMQGMPYFLKVKSGSFYEPSCLVPRYLRDQGIDAVAAPLPTMENALWAKMGDWTVILYPYIEGDTGWNPDMTDEQWQTIGAAIRQIHQIGLPGEGFASLRKETFDPGEYSQQIREIEAHITGSPGRNQIEQGFRLSWLEHQDTIHAGMIALETLSAALQRRSGPFVICHADLHPANIIRNRAGQVFVIDWDDVMLAPKERDFIFVDDAPVEAATQPDASPFFQGYAQAEIDLVALTYYLWERAVTDLIVCGQNVLLRDNLGEAAKADEIMVFHETVGKGGSVEKALAAATHLPIY